MSTTTATIAKAAVASSSSSSPVARTAGLNIRARPSQERGKANHGWLKTFHTFSFASYHDRRERRSPGPGPDLTSDVLACVLVPGYESFGPLRVINEDRVEANEGFGTHPHQEFEIFSYIVAGELEREHPSSSVDPRVQD